MFAYSRTNARQFDRMLAQHKFAIELTNPAEIRNAYRKEAQLLKMAADGDRELISMLQRRQKMAYESVFGKPDNDCCKEEITLNRPPQITIPKDESVSTESKQDSNKQAGFSQSAADLIRYRDRLAKMDWAFEEEPNTKRHATGYREFNILRHVANKNKGAFALLWVTACKNNGFAPWKEDH